MAPYVQRTATLFGARISLIHVFDPHSYSGLEEYVRGPVEIAEEHQQLARERLDGFLKKEFPLEAVPRLLAEGDVATTIARAAKKGFDLIMMPTHAGVFRRTLLGSTTAKVLDAAECPVETSLHVETIPPRPLEHREWVCAIGLSKDSERVLRFAYRAAEESNARLTILHAIQSTDPRLPVRLDLAEEVESAERQQALERIDALQKKAGSHAQVRIAIGPVKEALLAAARHTDADGLIIGRSPGHGFGGRLADLTYSMVRDSPFPVISI